MLSRRMWVARLLPAVAVGAVVIGLVMWAVLPGTLRAADSDTMSLEGKAAPDVSLQTMDGQSFQLSKLKGSVVMLDYWATWCPPCRASLPNVNKLSQDKDLAAKGLKVYAINCRETQETAQKFVQDNHYTFTVPLDPSGEFGTKYLVQGIPTTVIVGRDGTIKDVFIGYGPGTEQQLRQALDKALAEPQAS